MWARVVLFRAALLLLAQCRKTDAVAKFGRGALPTLLQAASFEKASPSVTVAHAKLHTIPAKHPVNLSDSLQHGDTTVISSWFLFHVPGNLTAALASPGLPGLVGGLREALSATLQVCRPAVNITGIRSANVEGEIIAELEAEARSRIKKATIGHQSKPIIRRDYNDDDSEMMEYLNLTQIRVAYEVRIFDEMRTSEPDVARRVDGIQTYSRFADLDRMLGRSLSDGDLGELFTEVTLDDAGYASFRQWPRPALHRDDLVDCAEEGLLYDAREMHQYTMIASFILVLLIAAASSVLFTVKRASAVPSRWNPLINADQS